MRKVRLAILASAVACLAAVAAMAGPAAGTVAPLTLVSGPSPFAGCTHTGTGGTNYLNAEVEPWVAVSPAKPSNISRVYQQDRWSTGGALGLVASLTHDGATTLSRAWCPVPLCSD